MRYINNRYTKQDMRKGHTVGAAQLALKIRKRRAGADWCGNLYQEVGYHGSQENKLDNEEQHSS